MVGVKAPPSFLRLVEKALIDTLAANGVRAKVQGQRISGTKLYRLAVLSPQFKSLRELERQDLVWRIVDKAVSRDDQMRIAVILTLTPDEAEGK
jgi:hypothetical protein